MNTTPTQTPVAAVIVLAAGGGTRMKSKRSKLLHAVAGRPMLSYAVDAARALEPRRLVVVVGHLREQVEAHLAEYCPEALTVEQPVRNGTGGAVAVGMEKLADVQGEVVVTYGDVPMLNGETLKALVAAHRADQNSCTVLTAMIPDPTGYGRIVREAGQVARIVEHKDATEAERAINEINSGIYVFDAQLLRAGLPTLQPNNVQGELYVTDMIGYTRGQGRRVGAFVTDDLWQTEGVNDRVQLAAVGRELNRRVCEQHMRAGVTIVDPATTWIDVDVTIGRDTTVLPGTQLLGATVVAEDAVIGPDTTLKDCEVGSGARVVRAHGELAVIGPEANVGPFTYMRPGTLLGRGAKLGAFVEAKNAQLGDGAKVPHLSYVGDAEIGAASNIGAGTIFANYDGVEKHHSKVGRHVRTGSGNVFVAPVELGDGAATGAGAVVRRNVPPGALAVSGGPQRNLEGWTLRRRAGTPQAEAAEQGLQREEQ